MATIDITQTHKLSLDEAKAKTEEFAKSMEARFGLAWKWDGDRVVFDAPSGAAKGTKGEVAVTQNNVRIALDLPFMLRMLKGTIEDKIKERLKQFA